MFIKQLIVCLFLMLLVMACSSTPERGPSSELNPPLTLDDVFIIKHRDQTDFKSGRIDVKEHLDEIENRIATILDKRKSDFKFELIESELPAGQAYRIYPEVGEDAIYRVKIFVQKGVELDNIAKVDLLSTLHGLFNFKDHIMSHYDVFEMAYNGRLNDQQTLTNILKMKHTGLKRLALDQHNTDIIQIIRPEVEASINLGNAYLAKEKTARNKEESFRKATLAELDRLSETEQFKSLVAAGKRKEVADLIDSYLPKEHMTPFEKAFWNEMLDIMRDPLPLEDRILVYRGIDGDMIYPAIIDGVELNKDVAKQESKMFMMSSMMTKNQGTWNRRLRSLQTMYDKFMGQHHLTDSAEFAQSARVTTFLLNHSRNPQGSHFLSFTPSAGIAYNFGKSTTAGFLIDPRALIANYASKFEGEREYLTTLVTFPDEMVKIVNVLNAPEDDYKGYIRSQVKKAVEQKIAEAYPDKADEIVAEIYRKNDIMVNAKNVLEVKELDAPVAKAGFLKKISTWFGSLVGKAETLETPPPVTDKIINKAPRNCNYLLQSLWIK